MTNLGIVKSHIHDREQTVKDLNEKLSSDANDIRLKYPDIAKMTVAEVVNTDVFSDKLASAVKQYKNARHTTSYYAFISLEKTGTFEPENFKKEYIACMDKESKLPLMKRIIVLTIGDETYHRTVKQMMKDYDTKKLNSDEEK